MLLKGARLKKLLLLVSSHNQTHRFSARLALDQAAVLQPDVDAPFTDQVDVVRRLLPYHIYHQPQEDLELLKGRKGKQKATDADLKAEVEGVLIFESQD